MQLKSRLRLAANIVKEERALARAVRHMPKPVSYEWARSKLVPLLAGPRFDEPGEEIVRATAGPGCAVEIGLDLGGVFTLVDRIVAQRWECSADQLRDLALDNLRRRLGRLQPSAAATGTLSGRIVRHLRLPRGCAASALLLSDELVRLFGEHDQVFAAVARGRLVSFPIDMPAEVMAHAVTDMEINEPRPLLLEPFVLLHGEIHWQAVEGGDDEDFPLRAIS